jgi:hypothetical protein
MRMVDQKRFGLIMRTFAPKPELVEQNVERVARAIEIANETGRFSRIDVLVSADKRHHDADCGKTATALRLIPGLVEHVFVSEVQHGDLYCGLLNYGIGLQTRHRIDYSTILSTEVASYLNLDTLAAIIKALEDGARVVGVAMDELTDSVLDGRVSNAFATWDNVALTTVGAFDLRARKPFVGENYKVVSDEAGEQGEMVSYNAAGAEEIIPAIRLVQLFGPCIAPVLPQGPGIKQWVVPDKAKDADGYDRHMRKMATRHARQAAHAASIGADLDELEAGVMPAYRRAVSARQERDRGAVETAAAPTG